MTPEERPKAPPTTKKEATVKKQTVAGFVVCRKTEEGVKYLLLYRRGTYWNFPKGKFEEGENDLSAALRELNEETGLAEADLAIVPGFKTQLRYNFKIGEERIYDTVILYLAETEKADVVISPREHSGYAWFLFADAMKVVGGKYVGTKRVLKQAHDFMRKLNGEPDRPQRQYQPRQGGQRRAQQPASGQQAGTDAPRKRFARRGRRGRGGGNGQAPRPAQAA
jgi:bis(5'-nucleosidyl)-tetraphosphatase